MVVRKAGYTQAPSVRKIYQNTFICCISSILRCSFFFFLHIFTSLKQGHIFRLVTSCHYNWVCFFFFVVNFFQRWALQLMTSTVHKVQRGWQRMHRMLSWLTREREQRWEPRQNREAWNPCLGPESPCHVWNYQPCCHLFLSPAKANGIAWQMVPTDGNRKSLLEMGER